MNQKVILQMEVRHPVCCQSLGRGRLLKVVNIEVEDETVCHWSLFWCNPATLDEATRVTRVETEAPVETALHPHEAWEGG